ncbi:MAG: Diguanylate cyclase with sensor [Sphingomonadales bacterium]|nr:Diguanylate cyclase with sensor [Sphingomonadales bacterium]
MPDAKLFDEAARLAALRRYNVLDTAPEETFDKITSLVRTVLGVSFAAVTLVDQTRMWFKSNQGMDGVVESPREISFCTHTIEAREPMVVPDARLDPRFRDNPAVQAGMVTSYAGVPLATPDGYNVGALCVFDAEPREFAPAHVDLLKNFGALVVDELELRQIAQCDQLTGALTRRGFLAAAEREIARRDRYGRPSALVMFDIDHFKSVNDRFGHPVGDEVLKNVAQRCRDAMRPNDVLGRIGGEEFALLLPEVDATDAMRAAERFRRRIENPAMDVGQPIHVTASFGIASLDLGTATPEAWLARADVPLYGAKRGGRNRCCQAATARPVCQMA